MDLIYKAPWPGARSGLSISVLEKPNWFRLTSIITLALLMWKWIGLFLRKSRLDTGVVFLLLIGLALLHYLLLKLPPRKLEPWFVLWSFFLHRLLSISRNLPYGFAWNTVVIAGAPSCYLELMDKLQKQIYGTVGSSLDTSLEPSSSKCNQLKSFL